MKNVMFAIIFLPFISIGQTGAPSLNNNGVNSKKSFFSKDLNLINEDLENAKKFQKILDSNKDVKAEYLLAIYHLQKGRRELGKSLIGLGLFGILAAVAGSNENESIGIVAVGALGYSLYSDIASLVHIVKANNHIRKAYKLSGLPPPGKKRK
jgi:hypothetical protein